MEYKQKIQYAEKVSEDLMNDKPLESIKKDLEALNLYPKDIDSILLSSKNIIGEKIKPLIREKLLANQSFKEVPELSKIDPDILQKIAEQEFNSIAAGEKAKVKALLEQGAPHSEIAAAIRTNFYPRINIDHQIETFNLVKKENSGSNRMIKIGGGFLVMLVGIGISVASSQSGNGGVLFYGLIIYGLILMVRGFMTVENPY